jgi:hypothetical protein
VLEKEKDNSFGDVFFGLLFYFGQIYYKFFSAASTFLPNHFKIYIFFIVLKIKILKEKKNYLSFPIAGRVFPVKHPMKFRTLRRSGSSR